MAKSSGVKSGTALQFTIRRRTEVGLIRRRSKSAFSQDSAWAPGGFRISKLYVVKSGHGTVEQTGSAPEFNGGSTARAPVVRSVTYRKLSGGQITSLYARASHTALTAG